MKKIDIIIGARPNFIKAAGLLSSFSKKLHKFELRLIISGQHYNKELSTIFIDELKLNLKKKKFKLTNKNSVLQISEIISKYQNLISKDKPNLIIVFGDVNTTLAMSIVANKNNIKLAHVESGLRSYDLSMPEEHNRKLTDHLSDFLFVTSTNAKKNLINEGINKKKIFFVGNVMIDTLKKNINKLKKTKLFSQLKLDYKDYILLTLHRPSNLSNINNFKKTLMFLSKKLKNYKIIFPVHPVTSKLIKEDLNYNNIIFVKPMGYLEFIFFLKNSNGVITDSGGITEESTYLNIPCITLRDNTERPETITFGTNRLSIQSLKEGQQPIEDESYIAGLMVKFLIIWS